jgi:hypothetical protein
VAVYNHLGGGPVVRAWDQEICSLCGRSSHVVAYMMATGDLYGR